MKTERTRIVEIIDFWRRSALEEGLKGRSVVPTIDSATKEIVDIVGPRRSGKSSVIKLLIRRLGLDAKFLYINFEDPFFIENNKPSIIEELVLAYKEYFGPDLTFLFFDEIQAIEHWENAIRKLRDSGEYKVYVTGSSSKLLRGEAASLLTGRHLSYRVMPLSFAEFLDFNGVVVSGKRGLLLKGRELLKRFSEYLALGGFPAVVLSGKQELLKQYFFDIIQKDIVARHSVRERGVLERMAVYLITNSAKLVSIESLKKTFGVSYKLAASFVEYLKEGFLIFDLPQFSLSLKRQEKAFKKIYAVDCGLANAVSFRFSEDRGRSLENCVFLHLLRMDNEIYYYKTKQGLEVDFFVRGARAHNSLIQVAWDLRDEDTKKREIRALCQAMSEVGVKKGLILTYEDENEITQDGARISIMPVYRWLLEQ